MNGFVWVSKHVKQSAQLGEEGFDAEAVYSNVNDVSHLLGHASEGQFEPFFNYKFVQPIDSTTRSSISRIINILNALARHNIPITDTLLNDAYEWTIERGLDVADLNSNDDAADEMILEITTGVA